ncbi:bile acid-CoA ligase [Sphingobium indicum IP26]|nr:bile acid-CoA ligase [Sphingobium indicum IP26]EQB03061.1 bile acid-CoA ligase [Sphingobium sp. HDIP04]
MDYRQMQYSIGDCIRYWAERLADEPAIVDEAGEISWRDLDRSTNRLARAYRDAGVGEGDFVTIMLPNGREFYQASIAAWKVGAIPQPISARMPPAERSAIIDIVSPRLIVGSEGEQTSVPQLPAGFLPDPALSDEAMDYPVPPYWKAVASGGSTGRPKVIVSRQPGIFDPLVPEFRMPVQGRQLVAGPLYHNASFMCSSRGLFCGNRLIVMERFDAERALDLIDRHRIDWTIMVPTMMHRIARLPAEVRDRHDMSSLRTVVHTAAPCPPWLKAEWIEWLGADVVQEAYGGTEGCGTTWISGEEWLARPGSVGRAVEGCAIKVVDDAGQPVPAGVIGEVYMRPDSGPGSTYFYLGGESRRSDDGWETIGDMGHVDEEGYLFLADRRTDLIISGGANVYPAEVEAAIDAFPGVRSSAVIGLPDDDLGNRVHAIIDAATQIDPEALKRHLAERIVRYKIPRTFEFVADSIRDEAGKVRRSALRAARMDGSDNKAGAANRA